MKHKRNTSFLTKHAKSSAVLFSLVLHAVLIVIALTYVAVSVINKEEQQFKAKPVNRPHMQLKKLQVPVSVKKKKMQKPKLRKRIVVQPKINNRMPDIQMPEMTGVKGGIGNASGSGLGAGAAIGFNMPELNLFGVKGRGEKVYIILDVSGFMMLDSMGGIPAYTIIKSELVRILEELNPTILFNIAIYESSRSYQLFPSLVPASDIHVAKVEEWLAPLNAVSKGMGNRDYGVRTQGDGAEQIEDNQMIQPLKESPGDWAKPGLQAMQQQADVIFLLSCRWGSSLRYKAGTRNTGWTETDQKKYDANIVKARSLHKKENERRSAEGEPPRVVTGSERNYVHTYIPDAKLPPSDTEWYWYSPEEMVEAFRNMQAKGTSSLPRKSGFGSRKSGEAPFTLNVIHFVPETGEKRPDDRLKKLAGITKGEYRKIEGMPAIKHHISTVGDTGL